jgi:hypothetical protein
MPAPIPLLAPSASSVSSVLSSYFDAIDFGGLPQPIDLAAPEPAPPSPGAPAAGPPPPPGSGALLPGHARDTSAYDAQLPRDPPPPPPHGALHRTSRLPVVPSERSFRGGGGEEEGPQPRCGCVIS